MKSAKSTCSTEAWGGLGLRKKIRSFLALKGNIPALALAQLISSTNWNMFEVIWQPYALSLGASVVVLGALGSIQTGIGSGLQFITGRISDSLGRKPVQVVAYLCSIAALLISTLSNTWYPLVLSAFLFALGGSLWDPANTSMIAESVERWERGTAYSVISLSWFIPGFFAPTIAGYLALLYGLRQVLLVCMTLEFISLLTFVLLIKETLIVEQKIELHDPLRSVKRVFGSKLGLSKFYIAVIGDAFAWRMTSAILFGILTKTYRFTPMQLGSLLTAFCVVSALSQIPVGRAVDKYGRKKLLITSEAVGLAVLAGYVISQEFSEFLIWYGLFGIVASTWFPAYQAYIANAVSDEARARAVGDLNALRGLISLPAPLIGGILFDLYGFDAPILTSLILLVVVLLILTTIEER